MITANTPSTIVIMPHARPSRPSVILIAFTIPIVMKNVMIGYQIPRCIGQSIIGQRFM